MQCYINLYRTHQSFRFGAFCYGLICLNFKEVFNMQKIPQKDTLSMAFRFGYTTREKINFAYKRGLLWDYERDFLLEYFNV